MSCYLKGGPDLVFLDSGVSVKVRDLTTRSSHSRYAYAKIRVSLDDADTIKREANEFEPVEIQFEGTVENRYTYPEDDLRIGRDEAWLKLYDARKILDRGVLTNYFTEVKVSDVLDYIIANKDDPYGVISGWKAVDPAIIEQSRQTVEEDVVEALRGENADADTTGVGGYVNRALGGLAEFIGWYGISDSEFQGLEFEDTSPNEALSMLEGMFGFTSWVDDEGVLWVGQPEAIPKTTHVVSGLPTEKRYQIADYNVTEGGTPVTRVKLTGKTKFYNGSTKSKEADVWLGNTTDKLFPIAEAWIKDAEGGQTIAPRNPINVSNLESLEQAAMNTLIEEVFSFRNGTIIFNASASTEKDKLAQISIGDIIVVNDYISKNCSREVDGGAFVVEEVQHKVNTRQGWKITCEVAIVPPPVDSMAVWYNPADDKAFSDLESYKSDRYQW